MVLPEKKKQTSKKYGEYKEEPCSTQLSTKENHVNGRDNSESEGAVTANGSAILSKEKPKDVRSNEDSGELQVDEGLQAPSTNRKVSSSKAAAVYGYTNCMPPNPTR